MESFHIILQRPWLLHITDQTSSISKSSVFSQHVQKEYGRPCVGCFNKSDLAAVFIAAASVPWARTHSTTNSKATQAENLELYAQVEVNGRDESK